MSSAYRSGSPSIEDIEAYSATNTTKLDEAELAKFDPHNICLEVPFQVWSIFISTNYEVLFYPISFMSGLIKSTDSYGQCFYGHGQI